MAPNQENLVIVKVSLPAQSHLCPHHHLQSWAFLGRVHQFPCPCSIPAVTDRHWRQLNKWQPYQEGSNEPCGGWVLTSPM